MRQLTGLDAQFLALETPQQAGHVSGLALLDPSTRPNGRLELAEMLQVFFGTAYEGGRSAGSLAWAGIQNTFFWIDPRRGVCGVLLMQFLPFCDEEAIGLLHDFERSVYASLK